MVKVTLGNTGITVNKNGFGALPIQRISKDEAVYLLRKAYDNGIDFYDTAAGYTDSQEKIGAALSDVRDKIYIATKSGAQDAAGLRKDIENSLRMMKTDYIDIFQLHNPSYCPKPGDEAGLYDVLVELKEKGIIRHIGISNHLIYVANEALQSGLYETIQFPFSYLSSDIDIKLVNDCKAAGVGFIAMKSLSGGLLTNAAASYAYQAQFDNLLPIWGIQRESELDEFISFNENPPIMTEEFEKIIAADREMLSGQFCRACGYCMPCPAGIYIRDCARMSFNIRRFPTEQFMTEHWQNEMRNIDNCLNCGHCVSKCPYGLNTPELLKENQKDYFEVLNGKPLFPFTRKK